MRAVQEVPQAGGGVAVAIGIEAQREVTDAILASARQTEQDVADWLERLADKADELGHNDNVGIALEDAARALRDGTWRRP